MRRRRRAPSEKFFRPLSISPPGSHLLSIERANDRSKRRIGYLPEVEQKGESLAEGA